MTEHDFLDAIDDDPGAEDTYLVYADWLEEQGQTNRARLVRAAVKDDRSKQAQSLLAKCQASWPGYQQWSNVFDFEWVRGLPSTVHFNETKPPADSVLRDLPAFPWVTALKSTRVPRAELVARLAERSRLHTFCYLSGYTTSARVGAPGLQQLAEMASWKGLVLYDAGVTDAGLAHLAPLRQLRVLDLAGNAITDAGIGHLAGLRHLVELDLSYTKVTSACLDVVLRLKQLRKLRLSSIETIDDTNVARLSALRQLRELDLARTNVTRFRLLRLLRCPNLKRLHLEGAMAIEDEPGEMNEVNAFVEEAEQAGILVDMDWE
jgi:uncharacterized protein (TIGR02996 family)